MTDKGCNWVDFKNVYNDKEELMVTKLEIFSMQICRSAEIDRITDTHTKMGGMLGIFRNCQCISENTNLTTTSFCSLKVIFNLLGLR